MSNTAVPYSAVAASEQACCALCGTRMGVQGRLHDDRYGYPGQFALLRCPGCGHRRLDARLSDAQIGDLYTRFYPRSQVDIEGWSAPTPTQGLAAWWRGDLANAFRWVPPNVRVLDIGCGFGESLGYHRARGCDAHGVEADANILRVAERHGLQVRHGLFDPSHYAPASFDVVTLDQVIEHVTDPAKVLRGIRQVLKPGGLLLLSTPNADGWGARLFGRRWIHWHAPYHLQFFSRESMKRAVADAGFVLERRVTVTPSSWLDYQWGHLVTFPRGSRPSPYWQPQSRRSLSQRIALRLLLYVHRTGINAAVTRLMDALGQGDNGVYLLRSATD
jgi:2-polyprenyl-3-methyl-5-hydroxy-6-metoxy-1,4-benzoquinol methylase